METIYIELNNWSAGEGYPNCEPFLSWFKDDCHQQLMYKRWVEENKLCVIYEIIDMSFNYLITAPKEWVEKNCPDLLTEHKQFLRQSNTQDETPIGQTGTHFLEYKEENIGLVEGIYF